MTRRSIAAVLLGTLTVLSLVPGAALEAIPLRAVAAASRKSADQAMAQAWARALPVRSFMSDGSLIAGLP